MLETKTKINLSECIEVSISQLKNMASLIATRENDTDQRSLIDQAIDNLAELRTLQTDNGSVSAVLKPVTIFAGIAKMASVSTEDIETISIDEELKINTVNDILCTIFAPCADRVNSRCSSTKQCKFKT